VPSPSSFGTFPRLSGETGHDLLARPAVVNVCEQAPHYALFFTTAHELVPLSAEYLQPVTENRGTCRWGLAADTLDPDTAQPNPEVMRGLARDHEGKAGVYGAVVVEGTIRPQDKITLQD
jgi:hypothetical protein